MHLLSKTVSTFTLWLFSALAIADGVLSPESQLLDQLNSVTTLNASFSQLTTDRVGTVVNVSEGKLWAAPAGKFKIHATSPFEQILVSNGEDFYTYDPDLEQVIVRSLVKDVTQTPILLLGNARPEFLANYAISEVEPEAEQEGYQIFLLEANDPSSVFEMLNLEFLGNKPSAMTLKDSLGQTTRIDFSDVVVNVEPDANLFEFVVPDNVDLIDDR